MPTEIPKKGRLNQIYIEKDKVKLEKLICAWCGDIYLQPRRLYCGHTLCRQCVDNEIQRSKRGQFVMKCLICGSIVEEDEIGEDRIGKSIVESLKVRCSSKDCKWQGDNRDFLQHYKHDCQHNQRTCDSRYEYTYYSNRAEFMRKLNDDEQKRQHKPNMLHPDTMLTLREKIEKQWEIQQQYNDDQWKRKTKRFRKTFNW